MRHNDEPFGLPSTGSRRITQETKGENRLKHVAGLLEKLTYAEMTKLSRLLQEHEKLADDEGYPAALLEISKKLLEQKD